MEYPLTNRSDMYPLANNAHFYIRHFARGSWYVPPDFYHHHPFFAMPVNRVFFPLRNPTGECNYIAEPERKYVLQERHLYFIPAEYPVRFQLDSELYFLSFQFNLELYPGVDLFSCCRKMQEIAEPACLEPLLALFDTAPAELPFSALKLKGLMEAYVPELIARYPRANFDELLTWGHYMPLLQYLEKTCDARTRVSDLAALSGESRESFTRKFSSRTKLTPKALIDRILAGKAMELLRQSRSVKETAAALNFSSEFVFSNFFKRCTGSAPLPWMRRMHSCL